MANLYDYQGNVISAGGSVEIADNLTTNSSTTALSAAQGVVLKNMVNVPSPIPSGLTQYPYNGVSIDIATQRNFAVQQIKTLSNYHTWQGGDCFGDYLFMFTENNTTCWVINMSTGQQLQAIDIPSNQRGFVSNCHCDTVNFSSKYYSNTDSFPLIYVSTGYPAKVDDVYYSAALVYRIIVTEENGQTSYSLELVQTIKIESQKWSEFVVGGNNDAYIKLWDDVHHIKLPELSDGSEIIIDFSDEYNMYRVSPSPITPLQGAKFLNGKIIRTAGAPGTGEGKAYLLSLNPLSGSWDAILPIGAAGNYGGEPEALFVWNNKLCVVFRSSGRVWAIYTT